MELVRNPTDETIRNWVIYNKKKNALNQRLQERVKEYLRKNPVPKVQRIYQKIAGNKAFKSQVKSQVLFDPSRYRIRMYFDSKCPHCKRMFNTLLKLQNRGVYVEALQIDEGFLKKVRFPIPIQKASKSEIKKHGIKTVPFTLIADLKKKVLYPAIHGFQSVEAMTTLLKKGETL